MASEVTRGVYRWFTAEKMGEEKARYIQAVETRSKHRAATGNGQIVSGGPGGQSMTFSFGSGVGTLEEWGDAIEDALAQLNDEELPLKGRTILTSGGVE